MPVSRQRFRDRWPGPPSNVLREGFRQRLALYVVIQHAGTAITMVGIVVAGGGALIAVGIVEVTKPHGGSPFSNGWVDSGLALIFVAFGVALYVFVNLAIARGAFERWRSHLAGLTREAQLLLAHARTGQVDRNEVGKWYDEVLSDLGEHDLTGSMTVRFESAPGSFDDVAATDFFLEGRIKVMCEFLQELHD